MPTVCTDACRSMPTCSTCGLQKKPRGRSAPIEMAASLCGPDCAGYSMEPLVGHLWPQENPDTAPAPTIALNGVQPEPQQDRQRRPRRTADGRDRAY